eukprot:CAMPEP_0181106344 /NCGR_PEP_ID=MMETSP1071-20121207/16482_1 /TAXON_ID=35127 /ORGANISM="Thalassiosira sp., Strain NH16" /LENGTH=448 /DNA_ID=CAMNT_0023189745 /DNA_START=40 /DNA_END=1387 /DNA_ORIENTATION=-
MPYRIATSLLLLQHGGVVAFRAPSPINNNPLGRQRQRQWSASSLNTANLESEQIPFPPLEESILDDGRGHVNGDLARAIYAWEVEHSNDRSFPWVDAITGRFSTRDGLRLVDELAREISSSLAANGDGGGNDDDSAGISYSDLVQEGMVALLRAMSTYDNYRSHNISPSSSSASTAASFEEYARRSIHSSLLHFLAHSSRPIRLPLSLQTALSDAEVAADRLRRKLDGKEPTLAQVATEVGIIPAQLALYRKLNRSMASRGGNGGGAFVSVEDGMEVYDPTLAGVGEGSSGLHARRDLDTNSRTAEAATPSMSTPSSLVRLNSQEDDWTREPPERAVAPLREALADTEEINDPLGHTHHRIVNEELDLFLQETLSEEELTVIQLRFGLVDSKHGGKGWTAGEIGLGWGEDVAGLAGEALEKLRKAAAESGNWDNADDDNNDAYVEVSL